jgi:hypothetical protein
MFAGSETPSFALAAFNALGTSSLDSIQPRLYPCKKPKRRTEIAVNSLSIFNSLSNGFKEPWF